MGFASLQHIQESKVHGVTGFRLPASFRLQGLVTLLTVYSLRIPRRSCFVPAALLGLTLRSFLLAEGIRPVSRPEEPTYRFARLYTFASEDARAGLTSRGFWAFAQPASPWRPSVCLAHRPLDAPLGLTLPRFTGRSLDRDFARSPLTRFAARAHTRTPAPQSIDQLPLRLLRPASKPAGLG